MPMTTTPSTCVLSLSNTQRWPNIISRILLTFAGHITGRGGKHVRLFRRRSKKIPKLRVTGLCAGNSPGTGEFPAQMASNAEKVSIWWRHHASSKTTLTAWPAWLPIIRCYVSYDNLQTGFAKSIGTFWPLYWVSELYKLLTGAFIAVSTGL